MAACGAVRFERIESRNGLHTLEHAEAIGLGSRRYQLVSIDGRCACAVSNLPSSTVYSFFLSLAARRRINRPCGLPV